MTDFINPILGGLIISFSVILLMYLLGRIAGISGIFWGAVQPTALANYFSKDRAWNWLFLLGLPLGAWLAKVLLHISPTPPSGDILLTIIAGLLVGAGAKISSGCTSGHGVCGISRFSMRSIIATLVFMTTGIITVFIMSQFGEMI